LRDAFDAEERVLQFELPDLFGDGWRQLGPPLPPGWWLQAGLAAEPVLLQPQTEDAFADPQLLADQGLTEPFLPMQPDGLEFFSHGVAPSILGGASPPRGAGGSLLCYCLFIHVNTSFFIEVSTTLPSKSVS
jgi:hypothetical protein